MRRTGFAWPLLLAGITALVACQTAALRSSKIYIQQENWPQAREQLKAAAETFPEDSEAHFLLGVVEGHMGNYEAMNASFERSLELEPGRVDVVQNWRRKHWVDHYNAGIQHMQAGDHAEAHHSLGLAIAADPSDPDAYRSLGFANHKLDRPDSSVAAYRRALELAPDDAASLSAIAIVLYNAGRIEESLPYLERAAVADPENKTIKSTLATSYASMGRNDEALAAYQRALEVSPDDRSLIVNLGGLFWKAGDYAAAAAHYQRAVDLDPEDTRACRDLAMARLKLGDLEPAIALLEQVTGDSPADGQAWYWLGHAYANTGRLQESGAAFERAEALDSSLPAPAATRP